METIETLSEVCHVRTRGNDTVGKYRIYTLFMVRVLRSWRVHEGCLSGCLAGCLSGMCLPESGGFEM
ncbi:hypothetical protein E2C01_084022 [Portunus trituberculatus]|uniref:Uncharacterized protein n=1 Tax=Portunus trituberculatus TaxID=210409 RepID=A0A5B7IYU1_PORTR|nr:hypothetical protein [Portunus trituberculatus]